MIILNGFILSWGSFMAFIHVTHVIHFMTLIGVMTKLYKNAKKSFKVNLDSGHHETLLNTFCKVPS